MAEAATPPPSGPQSRAFRAVIDDVSKPRRSVVAKINTAVVDRYRTVVVPGGADFRSFVKNPAVLWQHGQDPTRGSQPVGHCSSIKYRRAEDDILAVTQFKSDEYSDRIFQNYVDGTLTSFSVDFIPEPAQSGRPTADELRSRPDWAGAECIFRRWELAGYSAVAYPGNPEALAVAVERGLWIPDAARAELPAATRDMAEGSGETGGYATKTKDGRSVVERDGGWCVECDGQVVSRHESQAEAEAALEHPEPAPERAAPVPVIPPLPDGVRTYTVEDLVAITCRSLAAHLCLLTEQTLRDTHDLARGRV
jgi:hypothetical protein